MSATISSPDRWLSDQLNRLKADMHALKNQRTQYLISPQGNCEALLGKVTHDHNGNATGLAGTGVAVFEPEGEEWTKLAPSTSMSWQAATLEHSWSNAGGGSFVAAYLKDALGFVHIRGTVTGGASSQSILTLPGGLCPTASMGYACASKAGTPGAGGFAAVLINSSGQVLLETGSNEALDLAGIAPFLAER